MPQEMVQVKMQAVTAVVGSGEECEAHLLAAEYLVVVLTKGLFRDYDGFATVLLRFQEEAAEEEEAGGQKESRSTANGGSRRRRNW